MLHFISFYLYDSNNNPFFSTIPKQVFECCVTCLFIISLTDLWINPSLDKHDWSEQAAYPHTTTSITNRFTFQPALMQPFNKPS